MGPMTRDQKKDFLLNTVKLLSRLTDHDTIKVLDIGSVKLTRDTGEEAGPDDWGCRFAEIVDSKVYLHVWLGQYGSDSAFRFWAGMRGQGDHMLQRIDNVPDLWKPVNSLSDDQRKAKRTKPVTDKDLGSMFQEYFRPGHHWLGIYHLPPVNQSSDCEPFAARAAEMFTGIAAADGPPS